MEVVLYSVVGGLVVAAILGLLRVRYVVGRMNLELNRARADYGSSPRDPDQLRAFSREVDNALFKMRRVDGVLMALSMKPYGQGRLKSAWNVLSKGPLSMEFDMLEPLLRSAELEGEDGDEKDGKS